MIRSSILAAALVFAAAAAHAETRETLVSYRDWQVRSWETDSGEKWCIAEARSEVQAVRRPTKPTYGSKQRRLRSKAIRSEVKSARRKLDE